MENPSTSCEKPLEYLWRDRPPRFHRCEGQAEAREMLRSGLEVWVLEGSEVVRVEPVEEGYLVVGWDRTWFYKSVTGAIAATERHLKGEELPKWRIRSRG